MLSYFFLMSLFKSDENLERMAGIIGEEYRKISSKRFPSFGVKKYSNSAGYGYGEQDYLVQELINFSNKFPTCILGYYHFYWNCKYLTIYTINKGEVYIDKHQLFFNAGPYEISTKYSFKNTQIPNNITSYLNDGNVLPNDQPYTQPFEKTFII